MEIKNIQDFSSSLSTKWLKGFTWSFEEREKNGVSGEKLLRTKLRVKIHDKLNSHMALLRIHTQVTFNRGNQTLTKNMPSQPPNIDNKESLHGVH